MTTQTQTKHTAGPWKAVEWSCHAPTTIKARDVIIAECSGHGRDADESLADSRLIAAAPEMLEALIAVMDVIPFATNPIDSEIHQRAYAVIRKAKGELS